VKLQYYLRGLGIGIVVTALIMGLTGREPLPLTDAEIKAKAAELGMVEPDAVRLPAQTDEPDSDEEPSQISGEEESVSPEARGSDEPDITSTIVPTGESGEILTASGEENSGEESSDEGSEGSSDAESGDGEEPSEAGEPSEDADTNTASETEDALSAGEEETVSVTIQAGTGSAAVCKQLEEAGLIENAHSFDRYLIDNGYSKKISIDSFEVPVGATEDEIAKIITKTR